MNTPNKLTVLRILLVPILILFLLCSSISNRFLFATIVFVTASLTDHLDGKIAREKGQITDFGKFLDPLADKMLVMSAYICFVDLGLIGAVPVIIVLMREFMVTSIRLVAMGQGKVVSANLWGKIKTVSQIIAIITILIIQCVESYFELGFKVIGLINNIVVWISVIFTVVSGIIYIKENFNFIKNAK